MMTTNRKKKEIQVLKAAKKNSIKCGETIGRDAGGGSEVQSRVGVPSPGKEVSSYHIILSSYYLIILSYHIILSSYYLINHIILSY